VHQQLTFRKNPNVLWYKKHWWADEGSLKCASKIESVIAHVLPCRENRWHLKQESFWSINHLIQSFRGVSNEHETLIAVPDIHLLQTVDNLTNCMFALQSNTQHRLKSSTVSLTSCSVTKHHVTVYSKTNNHYSFSECTVYH